ncbi:type II CAAX prenyl endopeptidase Rce1 family protein [Citricoccus parietis]|uniref:Type II CAAX prenyl endopeptidase Rce1 family protein n=2 Tax=Citricoccus parietis TaxID=592307 RepID=A0ABV5G249_9MICC
MTDDPRQAPQHEPHRPADGHGSSPQGQPTIPAGWPKRGRDYGRPQQGPLQPAGAGVASHGAGPGSIPPGWPGRRPQDRIVLDPGKPTWMDLVTVLAYLIIFILGAAVLVTFIPGFREQFTEPDGTLNEGSFTFSINLISYSVLTVLALIACWKPFIASFRTFKQYGWLKIGLIPVIWFVCIMVNALVVMAAGQPIKSANQLAIEEMTTQVAFLPMVLVTVFMAPFVEEYIFRHLMIGKLSRWINVWVCVVISMVLFALIHFLSTGFNFDPVQVIPYLTLAAAITVAYVLTGKSLAYATILHVFNNLISIVVAYTLLPLLPEGM